MNNILKAIPLAALMAASWTQAAPHLNRVNGTVSDGETITIFGSDFGRRGDTPILFDQTSRVWENGSKKNPYSNVPDGGKVPTGEREPYRHNLEGFFSIVRNNPDSDSRFSYYHASIGQNPWGHFMDAWLAAPTAVPNPAAGDFREMYMTWLLRLSFEPTKQTGSHKFIRVWDTTGGREKEIRISWTQMHMTYQGGDSDWADTPITPNTWARLELYINVDRGRIVAWINGRKVHNIVDFAPDGHTGLQPRLIGWDSSGDARYRGETVDLARLYIDSSPARVELCDSPRWRQCKSRAIQASRQWSDDEIKVNLSTGRLDDLGDTYLYVVNTNGRVNAEGYPLCRDCSSESDRTPRVRRQWREGR